MISPTECNHFGSYLLQGHNQVSTEGHEHSNVWLCPKCGQFKVVADKDGVWFEVTFELVRDEHLEAAGQYIKYLNQEDVEPTPNTEQSRTGYVKSEIEKPQATNAIASNTGSFPMERGVKLDTEQPRYFNCPECNRMIPSEVGRCRYCDGTG